MIVSPVTGSAHVTIEREIPCDSIIELYRLAYQVDVSRYFDALESVALCRCLDSGYRFYHAPKNIEGDGSFYDELGKQPWYYMDWKWEHGIAYKLIAEADNVLEIGSGTGSFLKRLAKRSVRCTGLEMNEEAISRCKASGLEVFNERVQQHAANAQGRYDVVCSFQVFEHIAAIRESIEASIDCLKPEGKLIISVPNNGSFLGLDSQNPLNMPPHHIGLWDENSLRNIERFFPIRLKGIYTEPLQKYHKDYYLVLKKRLLNQGGGKRVWIGLMKRVYDLRVLFFRKLIRGHTILALFTKA